MSERNERLRKALAAIDQLVESNKKLSAEIGRLMAENEKLRAELERSADMRDVGNRDDRGEKFDAMMATLDEAVDAMTDEEVVRDDVLARLRPLHQKVLRTATDRMGSGLAEANKSKHCAERNMSEDSVDNVDVSPDTGKDDSLLPPGWYAAFDGLALAGPASSGEDALRALKIWCEEEGHAPVSMDATIWEVCSDEREQL